MKILYLRNVPDDVIERLEWMAPADGSSEALRELAHLSKRVDIASLLGPLPSYDVPTGEARLARTLDLGSATVVAPNWPISDPQAPSVSKPSCRHASYVAMPVAVARFSDRRPASMGMRTGSVIRGSANTSAGRPVGSAPNSSTSPVR